MYRWTAHSIGAAMIGVMMKPIVSVKTMDKTLCGILPMRADRTQKGIMKRKVLAAIRA
jgi:hypothetical protein